MTKEEKNIALGKYLHRVGVRYNDPFIIEEIDTDRAISHECSIRSVVHPKRMVDVFCYFNGGHGFLREEFNNSLQLYAVNTNNVVAGEIYIDRNPFWAPTEQDRHRLDKFLEEMTDGILERRLRVVPIATNKRTGIFIRILETIFGLLDKTAISPTGRVIRV